MQTPRRGRGSNREPSVPTVPIPSVLLTPIIMFQICMILISWFLFLPLLLLKNLNSSPQVIKTPKIWSKIKMCTSGLEAGVEAGCQEAMWLLFWRTPNNRLHYEQSWIIQQQIHLPTFFKITTCSKTSERSQSSASSNLLLFVFECLTGSCRYSLKFSHRLVGGEKQADESMRKH